ncbi:sensor histidine kinase [Clostridium frigidicarnis]|uniref:histidine kinase n=1 Tax=Clostridium frigidicarnis TaxID=84698 RepID=A0A1I1AXU4_9CLOT|nr:HAMP domain-containing sensor histidine kinase [Clostridium frigidicarnis]SFB42904.1 Histidine kinase-, DNA gyrase B-, and HSP90-like ATPase [Clostridium frigidicarnis]
MLVTKLKSKKVLDWIRKLYPFLFLLAIFMIISIYNTFNRGIKFAKIDIKNATQYREYVLQQQMESDEEYSKTNFEESKWISKYVSDVNVRIYSQTSYLKDIKEKSQEDLDKLGNSMSNVKGVKFFILHKPSGKYLTNNDGSLTNSMIEDIKNGNANLESEVEGVSYIRSVSQPASSPAVMNFENHLRYIEDPGEYLEAYWLPNTIGEDDSVYQDVRYVSNQKQYLDRSLTEASNKLLKAKDNLINEVASVIFKIVILGIIIFFMLLIDTKEGREILEKSFVFKFLRSIKNWLINRIDNIKSVKNIFACKSLSKKFMFFILTSILSVICVLSTMILTRTEEVFFAGLVVVVYIIFILPIAFKFMRNISMIIDGTDKIVNGDLNYQLIEKGEKNLSHLAKNINTIRNGFKVSIDDQFKNERLKSELVANVSHDLKTPLTSIINYTDILMREDITDEEREDYIKILNTKSLKLKSLIEDLFEVSKINSGKLELTKENINLVELIRQSLGEFSNSQLYSSKNLSFIFKTFSENITMNLDGKKMSRVFENLITNALKYSMENTRVYIDIKEIQSGIAISFKNISEFPLDFDKEEIFERFTRGDKSRTSNVEGNGLGLAIAKSLVECHNGKMNIDLDGDLFKVFIELYN